MCPAWGPRTGPTWGRAPKAKIDDTRRGWACQPISVVPARGPLRSPLRRPRTPARSHAFAASHTAGQRSRDVTKYRVLRSHCQMTKRRVTVGRHNVEQIHSRIQVLTRAGLKRIRGFPRNLADKGTRNCSSRPRQGFGGQARRQAEAPARPGNRRRPGNSGDPNDPRRSRGSETRRGEKMRARRSGGFHLLASSRLT